MKPMLIVSQDLSVARYVAWFVINLTIHWLAYLDLLSPSVLLLPSLVVFVCPGDEKSSLGYVQNI